MPLGSGHGREARGFPIHTEVLGRETVERWIDRLMVRHYGVMTCLSKLMINAPRNILDSEGHFEARELGLEWDHRHALMAA